MLIPQWVEEEFANASFGDKWLDKRLKACVAQAASSLTNNGLRISNQEINW